MNTANGNLTTLQQYNETVNTANQLAKRQLSDYTSEDYATAAKVSEEFSKLLYSEVGGSIEDLFKGFYGESVRATDALKQLSKGTDQATEIIQSFSAAIALQEAQQTYAAGEEERYELIEELSSWKYTLANQYAHAAPEERASEYWQKTAEDFEKQYGVSIKTAGYEAQGKWQTLEGYNKDYAKGLLTSAFASSGIQYMDQLNIANASLDRVIYNIASEWSKYSDDYTDVTHEYLNIFNSDGTISEDAKSQIVMMLRGDDTFAKLFASDSISVGKLRGGETKRQQMLDVTGLSDYNDIIKAIANNSEKAEEIITKCAYALYLSGDAASDVSDVTEDMKNEARDYLSLLDSSRMTSFANSLGLTREQLEGDYGDSFNWLTDEDIANGVDSLITKFTDLNDIFIEMIKNGSLTSQSLNAILTSASYLLIGENGDVSTDNLINNFQKIAIGNNSELQQVVTRQKALEAYGSSDFFKMVKTAFTSGGRSWQDLFSDVSAGELSQYTDLLNTATSFEQINELVLKSNNARNYLEKSITDTYVTSDLKSIRDAYRDIEIEYIDKLYDNEISNLESINQHLQDNNSVREKEIALLEAKQKLENAQKEKKRVYRAGVGFVYEADQEKVQEAQDEIEKAQLALEQENVNYQIELLQQQKSLIDEIPKNEYWKNLEDVFGKIKDAYYGENGIINGISSIAGIDLEDMLQTFLGDEEYEASTKKVLGEVIQNVEVVNQEADAMKIEDFKSSVEKARTSYGNYQSALKELSNATTHEDMIYGLDKVQQAYGEYQTALSNVENARKSLRDTGITGEKVFENDPQYHLTFGDQTFSLKDIFDIVDLQNSEALGSDSELMDRYALLSQNLQSADMAKEEAGEGNLSVSGFWDAVKQSLSGKGYYRQWANEAYGGDLPSGLGWIGVMADPITSSIIGTIARNSHASGIVNSPSEAAFINELGTEAIVTPSGTITALPSHTGVVPADLTRSLYDLGTIAPNLIKHAMLSTNYATNSNIKSEDNSTNIDTLYATFDTDKDFDVDQFLSNIRSVVNTTQHAN